jgi:hypothetical protein
MVPESASHFCVHFRFSNPRSLFESRSRIRYLLTVPKSATPMSSAGLFADPAGVRPLFPLSAARDGFPTSPNDLLYLGRRELRETALLKSALSTVRPARASPRAASGRAPACCCCWAGPYSGRMPLPFDHEEDAEESEGEPFLEFPARRARIAADSPAASARAPGALEEALRRQPPEAAVPFAEALGFVSELFCRATARPASARRRSARARSSQAPSARATAGAESARAVRADAQS